MTEASTQATPEDQLTTKTASKKAAKPQAETVIVAFKGFDADWKCRDMKYAIGQTFTHDGPVKACESGLHACEDPLHVLRYYGPNSSRFAIVEASGEIARHDEDSKIAAQRLTIKAELTLPGLIKAAIEYRFAKSPASVQHATAKGECAAASGYYGAATASGYYGAATASGYSGAATASGNYGAATASGDSGAATASGNYGAATASGRGGRARGADGCAIFLVERDSGWKIVAVFAGIAGRDGIKANTWYRLEGGKPVEVK